MPSLCSRVHTGCWRVHIGTSRCGALTVLLLVADPGKTQSSSLILYDILDWGWFRLWLWVQFGSLGACFLSQAL